MLKGYRIGNLVIRHSMVKVTSGPKSSKKESKKAAEAESAADDLPEPTELLADESVDLADFFQDDYSVEP
jgi:molecular chaperone GrpE (heat shock protein)